MLPYCSEAEFWDNENGFVNVGEYKNGSLVIYGNEPPQWLTELKKLINNNEL